MSSLSSCPTTSALTRQWLSAMKRWDPEPCQPPWWARNPHIQTIFGHYLPCPEFDTQKDERVEIPVEDGDCLVAFHRPGRHVVVYFFHGLTGHAQSDYMLRGARIAAQHGFAVMRVNHRGAGEGAGMARGIYHSGRAEDLSAVLAMGRRMHPDKLHFAVGFSLSGNALLLLLSGKRGTVLPDFGCAINAPIDLEKAARAIASGVNRLYDMRFIWRFRAYLMRRYRAGLVSKLPVVRPWWTIRDFDREYTAPEGGFRDPEDYYRSCSTVGLLAQIQTPVLMLMSADDPLVDGSDYHHAERSPHCHLHIQPYGGHMGYLTQNQGLERDSYWLDYYLDQVLAQIPYPEELVSG